jgi:ribosomal protein L18E
MRLGKQRGPYSKDAMPIGPHRTRTLAVNLSELERAFDDGADVSLEALVEKGVIKNTRTDVKILGNGELKKKLSVTAHSFSESARQKIESTGGKAIALREAPAKNKKRRRASGGEPPQTASEAAEGPTGADEGPDQENTERPQA